MPSVMLSFLQKVGAEVAKVNPTHIKLLNQYVECCCAEGIQEELLSTLKSVRGVIHVKLLSPSEGIQVATTNQAIVVQHISDSMKLVFLGPLINYLPCCAL